MVVAQRNIRSLRRLIEGPQYNERFEDFIAPIAPIRDWRFGSAATGGLVQIKNATDLAARFNPYEDFTDTTVVNNEVQRYQPFTSAENFVFGTDYLALKATIGAGCSVNVIGGKVDGTGITTSGNFPIARTNIAGGTTGISVGQICLFQYTGGFWRVTAVDATSVTIAPNGYGAGSAFFNNNGICFPPWYRAVLTSAITPGATTIAVDAVPVGVTVGMALRYMGNEGPVASGAVMPVVTSKTATTVTLSAGFPNGVGNGTEVWFMPYIKSAQFWTKEAYSAGLYDTDLVAGEWDVRVPGNSTNVQGWQDLQTRDPGEAMGAWPACWSYSSTQPDPTVYRDSSELDFFEGWQHSTLDLKTYTGFNHGPNYSKMWFRGPGNLGGAWDANDPFDSLARANGISNYLRTNTQLQDAFHKIQFIWTRDKIFRYVDGYLVSAFDYNWTSLAKAQFGTNLATGNANRYQVGNFFFPYKDSNFSNMEFKIRSFKLWAV